MLAPVIAAAATAAAAPYMPCVAAVTPRLVDDADLPGANAARSAVGGASIILGPAFGGVLMFLGSSAAAFALNALTFGLSAVAVLAIRDRGVFATRRPAQPQVAEHPAGLSVRTCSLACSASWPRVRRRCARIPRPYG